MSKKTELSLEHLRPETAEWFAETARDYALEPHHERVLLLAAEAWDRGQRARELLEVLGMIFEDRFGMPHARPEVAIERDSRIAFARLLRELALDDSTPGEARLPRIAASGGGG